MQKYIVTLEHEGLEFPISIKAQSIVDLNAKLSKYTYDKILNIVDKDYKDVLDKEAYITYSNTDANIYSQQLNRSKANRIKRFIG